MMSYPKFFNPEESYSRSEIEALQLERLQATVKCIGEKDLSRLL